MKRNSFLPILLAITIIFCLGMLAAGCGRQQSARQHEGVRIITSFYPMYLATINIAGGIDGVEVVNMTQPQTGCLHDYQLTTRDMKLLETGDILVVNGGGMEAFLDRLIKQEPQLKVVEASTGIDMLHGEGDEADEENPHVWVSIDKAIQQVHIIADGLCEYDPDHADAYMVNAAAYIEKLQVLQQNMHSRLDKYQGRKIVTFHEAFPYFAQEFGLELAGVIDREPGDDPSPRELEETIEQVRKAGVKVLFVEPQYSSKAAETIARETGAKLYSLDPVVTGEALPSARDAYIEAMHKNTESLIKAFSED